MALFDTIRAGASGAADDYQIDRSLRFNNDDSAKLSRTPSSDGNRTTMTFSVWLKRANLGEQVIFDARRDDSNRTRLLFDANNRMRFFTRFQGNDHGLIIEGRQRDVSAWYHLIWAIDTTQSTSSNRVKMYINGVQQSISSDQNDQPDQNEALFFNKDEEHGIGVGLDSGGDEAFFDGCMAELNFIDGQQLTPSSFAETDAVTGEYKPIEYTGSYGTNGFYLNFSDNSNNTASTLGKDSSGNGNNYTPSNFAATDSIKDSPTNNFCVWNTLDARGNDSTFSEGNLKCLIAEQGDDDESGATFAVSSGKWYWEEFMQTSTDNAGNVGVGVKTVDFDNFWRVRGNGGESQHNNTQANVSGLSWTNGDIIGILLDLDDGSWKVSKNGTLIDTKIHTNVSGLVTPMMHNSNSSERHTFITNWGQDSSFAGTKTAQGNTDGNGQGDFHYSVPSGYLALCSKNLPDCSATPSTKYFDSALWTGNGSSQNITGFDFSPDWVWGKPRSTTHFHTWVDTVRGAGNLLFSNTTSVEETNVTAISAFLSNGFTVGDQGNALNNNGETYVGWVWDVGDSTVTNNNGTISTQVRANTTAGISIATWTSDGQGSPTSLGHGLGVRPDFLIIKNRTGSGGNWQIWSPTFTNATNNFISLNLNDGTQTAGAAMWGTMNSTVINFRHSANSTNGNTMVGYFFSNVEGFSRSGKYTGNGSSDGTFIFTGFRPAWVMVKRTDANNDWPIADNKRSPVNIVDTAMYANLTNSDNTTDRYDFLANGFKIRNNLNESNANGGSYLYLAFAESPFKIARAR